MSQAFLGANPGTVVQDALEPELLDATVSADITSVTWVEVNFPGCVAVVAELGAIADTVTGLDIEVVGADDDSGTNQVSFGRFSAIDGADDGQARVLVVEAYKPYMGVLVDYTGSGNAPVRVVLRPKEWWLGNTRTA